MEQLSSPAAHTRSRAGSSRGSSLGPAERGASDAADSRVSAAGGAGGVLPRPLPKEVRHNPPLVPQLRVAPWSPALAARLQRKWPQ